MTIYFLQSNTFFLKKEKINNLTAGIIQYFQKMFVDSKKSFIFARVFFYQR